MKIEHKVAENCFVTTSYVYTRAQILGWVANGTSLINIFEKKASDLLLEIIRSSDKSKPLVVNFKGITNIDEYALDSIFSELEDNKRQLIIVNGHGLADTFLKFKKNSSCDINTESGNQSIILGKNAPVNYDKVRSEGEEALSIFLKSTLAATFREFDKEKRLCSTPIIANGEFNSSEVISNPFSFKWVVMFLSDELERIIQENRLNNVKLLSASLRGAPFASVLGIINHIEFETIDHFGPKHKVFDLDFIHQQERGINYIYIGDFVFGGTEVKIAKTYVEMKGSRLDHTLVLGSLLSKDAFENDFTLSSLVDLNDLSNGKAEFKLFTK